MPIKSPSKVYIIAEIGVNHNGDYETARQLIYEAHEAQVDAVKFQKRDLASIYSERILKDPNSAEWNFDYLIPQLQGFELSNEAYFKIDRLCKKLNLDLVVTPMDHVSLNFLKKLTLSAVKIASGDMVNFPLIKASSDLGLPLLISTGMWGEKDITKCSDFCHKNKLDFSLLLSNSTYPTPYEAIGLEFLQTLKTLAPRIGYSGHERGIFIPVAAAALGATIIEKHLTLDRYQAGPDHKASLTPAEFEQMVKDIRSAEKALTKNKIVNQQESLNKEIFTKSAVAKLPLKKDVALKSSDITYRSPGKGIFPHEIEDYIGRRLTRDIPTGKYISQEDFAKPLPIDAWPKFNFSKKWGVKCRFHDYLKYKTLKCPVIEFHCSESDLQIDFNEVNGDSELIVHAPEIFDRQLVNFCSTDKQVISGSVSIIQKTIDKTLKIAKNWPKAKPKMVVHLGGMSLDLLETTPLSLEALSTHNKMIEIALFNFSKLRFNPADISILPENLPPRPWYLGGEWYQYGFAPASDMVKFCSEAGVKMTYDICHAQLQCNLEGSTLLDYTQKIIPYISHLHISDAAQLNAEGLQIFEGDINFEKFFKCTKGLNFSWVTEIWSGHLHNALGLRRSLELLDEHYFNLL